MIQRKQTIFYLVALLTALIPLFGMDVMTFTNAHGTHHVTFMGSHSELTEWVTSDKNLLLTPPQMPLYFGNLVLIVLLVLTILLFKSLRLQLRLGRFLLGLYLLTIVGLAFVIYYIHMYMTVSESEMAIGAATYVLPVGIIFVWLGNRGVLKDKRLLDSVDRIR